MRIVSVLAVSAIILLITGCSGEGAAVESVPGGIVTQSSAPPSGEPASTTSLDVSTSTVTSPAVTTPTSPPGGPVIRSGKKELTLADAFEPEDWQEGSFDVPKVAEPVKAIAIGVGCNYQEMLEFRFSLQTGTLSVSVAQSLDSRSSTATLEFNLEADRVSQDVKKISFDQQTVLTTQLDGVSVVRIYVKQVDKQGCDTATALLTLLEIV